MRTFVWLAAASLTLCVAASPVSARVVRMETKVALEDQSEPSIRQALLEAFLVGTEPPTCDEHRGVADHVIGGWKDDDADDARDQ